MLLRPLLLCSSSPSPAPPLPPPGRLRPPDRRRLPRPPGCSGCHRGRLPLTAMTTGTNAMMAVTSGMMEQDGDDDEEEEEAGDGE